MPHALIVEDDVTAISLKALIVSEAFSVAVANTLRDARRQISLQQPDIVLLDLHDHHDVVAMFRAQALRQFQAVHARHVDVQDHAKRRPTRQERQRGGTVRGGTHPVAIQFDKARQRVG